MSAPFRWPDGRRCAVSLTYDDALPVHCEHVGPCLEAHGLRGTFYLNIAGEPTRNSAPWRELGARGHELGNHTLFHPCRRYPRSLHPWLDKSFDLRGYTPERFRLELQVANAFLHLLDGRSERSFAHTCYDAHIGRLWKKAPISDLIRGEFVAARATKSNRPVLVSHSLDLMRLACCVGDHRSFDELRDQICAGRSQAAWLIFVFHGIGAGTHPTQFVTPAAHEALINWLVGRTEIWVSPLLDVAKWVRDWQAGCCDQTRQEEIAEPH
ncbi:MAG TPA: polysaccharide deacetylase family protein [Xanthobacteraceae bacterium]|jgi:hypothetical protein|nr:polysaccharide deacetylase family protein [Xanthobacteraceae bacterium]